jgi:FkbM family methyltransferase
MLRNAVRAFLKATGLVKPLRACRQAMEAASVRRRYPDNVFTTQVNDRELLFRTRTTREKIWFFNRYKPGDYHERPATLELLRRLEPGGLFVDVGSFFGWFALVAASTPCPVLAIEADPRNFSSLSYNVALNSAWNIETLQAAATRVNCEVQLVEDDDAGDVSPKRGIATGNQRRGATVRGIALDDLVYRRGRTPKVIKIDVEGAEYDVVQGLAETLHHCHPTLLMELHPQLIPAFGASVEQVLTFLAERGYRILRFSNHHGAEYSLEEVQSGEVFTENAMVLAEPRSQNGRA